MTINGAPAGAGPSEHAALGDAERRTGTTVGGRVRLERATPGEAAAAARALGPGGLTAAEAAWCAGRQTSEPIYDRPVDGRPDVTAAALGAGGVEDGDRIAMPDGSELDLVPTSGHIPTGTYKDAHLIRLPRDRQRRGPAPAGGHGRDD